MAKPGALKVGEDLALTPGAVIDKDDRAELLQYRPTTETVRARPMLVVPPPIGRYYFLDLRPGRSFVEYAVSRGLQTFLLSWRNPGAGPGRLGHRHLRRADPRRHRRGPRGDRERGRQRHRASAPAASSTPRSSTTSRRTGDDRVHSASYAVTLLDFGQSAPIGAFSSARLLSLARWNSGRAGVISARAMGNAFTWMRPNDLVWNYWVNNYLMGEDPPVFDILSWNADGTNLPAALHRQFLDIFEHNPLPDAGGDGGARAPRSTCGTIKVPTYVTGASTTTSRRGSRCYRTTQLLSGDSTFALSNAGHIASLVNPPGNPKANYFTGPLDPDAVAARRGWRVPRSRPARGGSTGPTGRSSAPATRFRRPRRSARAASPAQAPAPGLLRPAGELRDRRGQALCSVARRGSDWRSTASRPALRKSMSRSRSKLAICAPGRRAWASWVTSRMKHIRMARWSLGLGVGIHAWTRRSRSAGRRDGRGSARGRCWSRLAHQPHPGRPSSFVRSRSGPGRARPAS